MKKLLTITIVLLTSLSSASADWIKEDGFYWEYNCVGSENVSSVIFVLHGTGVGSTASGAETHITRTGTSQLYDFLLSSCAIIVVPEGGLYPLDGVLSRSWDFTGYYTYGKEAADLISLLVLAKDLFNKPIYLLGGSGGGVMAYKVATELANSGRYGLLSGLILADMVSPYSLSLTGDIPTRYQGLDVTLTYTSSGIHYYSLNDSSYTYVQLGLPNDVVTWDIPTLVIYSTDDVIIPEDIKEDFATKLLANSTQTIAVISGTNHDIGDDGLQVIEDWLYNNNYYFFLP